MQMGKKEGAFVVPGKRSKIPITMSVSRYIMHCVLITVNSRNEMPTNLCKWILQSFWFEVWFLKVPKGSYDPILMIQFLLSIFNLKTAWFVHWKRSIYHLSPSIAFQACLA